jgi:hypothetical protein
VFACKTYFFHVTSDLFRGGVKQKEKHCMLYVGCKLRQLNTTNNFASTVVRTNHLQVVLNREFRADLPLKENSLFFSRFFCSNVLIA